MYETEGSGAESGEAGLWPVAVGVCTAGISIATTLYPAWSRRRIKRAGGGERATGYWLLGGVTGGLPPVPRTDWLTAHDTPRPVSSVFIQAGGYGGRHAPAMHPNCDVSRLGPPFELRRDRQQNVRPARWKMRQPTARAWCFAVGPRLERGVRHHASRCIPRYLEVQLPELLRFAKSGTNDAFSHPVHRCPPIRR